MTALQRMNSGDVGLYHTVYSSQWQNVQHVRGPREEQILRHDTRSPRSTPARTMPKMNFYVHGEHDFSNVRAITQQRLVGQPLPDPAKIERPLPPPAPPVVTTISSKPARRPPAYARAEDDSSFKEMSFTTCNSTAFKIVHRVVERAAGVRLTYAEENNGLSVRISSSEYGRRKAACTYILYRLSGENSDGSPFPFGLLGNPTLCKTLRCPSFVDTSVLASRLFKDNAIFLKAKEIGVLVDLTFLNDSRIIYIMAVDARPQQAMQQWIIDQAAHARSTAPVEPSAVLTRLSLSEPADSPTSSAASSPRAMAVAASFPAMTKEMAAEIRPDDWPALGSSRGGLGGGIYTQPAPPSTPFPLPETATAAMVPAATYDEDKSCKICMSEDVTHVFVPCGHMVACGGCAQSILKSSGACPICCKPCIMVMQVYD